MKQYGVWQALFLSFFSADLYRDVAHRWLGTALLYLFLLMAIASFATLYSFNRYVVKAHSPEIQAYVAQLPTFTVQQGRVSVDKPVPYSIVEPKTSRIVALIDTSGKINSTTDVNIPVVLLQDRVIVKDNEFKTTTYNLTALKDMVVTPQMVKNFIDKLHLWVFLIFWPLAFLAMFVFRLIQSLLYGLVGFCFSGLTRSGLSYRQCVRISMVALTPAVIIASVLEVMMLQVPYLQLLLASLTLLYVFLGVIANQGYVPQRPEVVEPNPTTQIQQ